MVSKSESPVTTDYTPLSHGFRLATLEEVTLRFSDLSAWSHSKEKYQLFEAWMQTWPKDSLTEWARSNRQRLPLKPWLWMYFSAKMRWRDALVNLGVTRKLFFNTTRAYQSDYAAHIEMRRAKAIAVKSIGNKKGAGRKVVIPDQEIQEMARSGLTVWQLHKMTGHSESAIKSNLAALGLEANSEVLFTKTKSLSHEDFVALERFSPGIAHLSVDAKTNPAAFFDAAYRAWLNMSYLSYRFKKLMRVMREQYRKDCPPHLAFTHSEGENCLARHLLQRNIPHARQVKITHQGSHRIADFTIHNKVVVEVDDGTHRLKSRQALDVLQTQLFENAGYRVLRARELDVKSNPDKVIDQALALLDTKE